MDVMQELDTSIGEKVTRIQARIEEMLRQENSLFVTSSSQTHSLPLLHILSRWPGMIPVYFIQTGFHFPETMEFRTRVAKAFGLQLHDVESEIPKIQQRDDQGNFYFTSDPDFCCQMNKVWPLASVIRRHDIWISGVRAEQSAQRSTMQEMEGNGLGGRRYHPMLHWTKREIWRYVELHELPRHPLDALGYASIGCMPCTARPLHPDERCGRWQGQRKTECGLHVELRS